MQGGGRSGQRGGSEGQIEAEEEVFLGGEGQGGQNRDEINPCGTSLEER